MTHTPEPWHIRPDGGLAHTSRTHGVTVDVQPMERYRPNLERAVACVNACDGIADPADAIAKAREALDHASSIASAAEYGAADRVVISRLCLDRIRAALAALGG